MDIAKIRKKAQEKQKESDVKEEPRPEPQEQEAEDLVSEETGPKQTQERDSASPAVAVDTPAVPPEPGPEAGRADEADVETKEDVIVEIITFNLSKEELAFKVSDVEEIIRFQRITKVPTMPDYVLGITSLRGKIIPVLDLRKRLGLRETAAAKDEFTEDIDIDSDAVIHKKILVISGPRGLIGVAIDKVIGVSRFPQSAILEPPAHLTETELKFLEGVVILAKRFISIIRTEETMNIEVS